MSVLGIIVVCWLVLNAAISQPCYFAVPGPNFAKDCSGGSFRAARGGRKNPAGVRGIRTCELQPMSRSATTADLSKRASIDDSGAVARCAPLCGKR